MLFLEHEHHHSACVVPAFCGGPPMEFENALHNFELTKVFCLPLRPKADEKIAAGFGAVERWSGGAVERTK